jgi:hypothetical protein
VCGCVPCWGFYWRAVQPVHPTSLRPNVSPVLYQNYTCQQLAMEAQAVSTRAAQVSGAQDSKRTKDQIATGVAVVLFWPAAFLVGGDGPTAAEVGQLKGQMVAIEQANIQKRCGIQFDRAQAPAR